VKTLLITGGAGYIGSHIGCLLAQHGYRIVVLDSLVYGQSCNYRWAEFVYGDFGDKQLLDTIFTRYDIYAVIHCAASIEVGASVRDPLAFYENNVAKTITLLGSMLRHRVNTVLFSSSCAVFGTPKVLPLTENHSFDPISPYGMTKYMMETIIKDMHNAYGLSYIIFRFFNAAGAWPEQGLREKHVPETHVIPLLLSAAQSREPFFIYGDKKPTSDGTCIRDFVHVLDIAYAHLLALSYLECGGASNIFNLGTGRGVSVKEMVATVECVCSTKVKVVVTEDRPGDPAILVADPGHAQKILGWRSDHSALDEIIDSAYRSMYPSDLHVL
jgi:UDP-glucose 4-epimerase